MRTFLTLCATLAAIQFGAAQTTADYLQLRNEQHIHQPTSGKKLDTVVGPSIVEVQGVVQGSFKSGTQTSLMVKRDDGQTLVVQCPHDPPEWLNNGEVPVRLLIHVNRTSNFDAVEGELISVAREEDIERIDEAYWHAEAAKADAAKKRTASRKSYPLQSRGGGNMYGWIGRRSHREVAYTSSDAVLTAYRKFILSRNHSLGAATADEIAQSVIAYSNYYNVDARLVVAVIICESDFHPMSTSHSGAMGLGQLMPGTAQWMGVSSPYDLRQNLYGTIKLLRTHMDQFHVNSYPTYSDGYFRALELVLAAYNAGEGAVRRHGGVPPYRETQAYVARVIAYFQRLVS